MPAKPIALSLTEARRFMRRATGLDAPFADVGAALRHLGHIQIDPINVCGRMQDLILRNRVANYREDGLMHFLHGNESRLAVDQRQGFEHHLPNADTLVALPMDAWPHLQETMSKRRSAEGAWSGKLTTAEKKIAAMIFEQMKEQGALSSREIEDGGQRAAHVWGAATLAKSTLQKLFFHGRVLISHRRGTRRYYDLPERILPSTILKTKPTTEDQTKRWLALGKLRQRRLCALTGPEHRVLADDVQQVIVEGLDSPRLFMLNSDEPLLPADAPPTKPLLLAPLDPILYDRKVTEALWSYDYRWEVYTPPHKRVRGYYALPLLSGTEIVGHIDPKADRVRGKLHLVSKQIRKGHSAALPVRELAAFLGLK